MGVRACSVCGERVLVSKAGYTESRGPQNIDPGSGVVGVAWIAHNGCVSRVRAQELWSRLIDACGGNEEQARRVLGMF